MQAARGTPVGARPLRLRLVFAAVALTAYALDLVSKILAVEKLQDRPDVEVVGELLQLHFTRNPGAAFSAGTEYTPVITCVAMVASVAVIWFARRLGSLGWAFALGFLLAGVVGNLTDRMFRSPGPFRGHVVDMFMLPNWPVFNVADICINIAAALILILAFRGIRLDGTRDRGEQATESTSDDAPNPMPADQTAREQAE